MNLNFKVTSKHNNITDTSKCEVLYLSPMAPKVMVENDFFPVCGLM